MNKLKLEIPVLLPESSACPDCVQRLQDALHVRKGIEEAHVEQSGDPPRLCLHYDPNLVSLAQLERQARQEGVTIQQRYRHRDLRLAGMDCADCALKLEKGVGQLDGVFHTAVDFASAKMRVEYDVEQVEHRDIVGRVRRMGYDVDEDEAGAALAEAGPGGLRGFLSFMRGKRRNRMTLAAGALILLAFGLHLTGLLAAHLWALHAIYALAVRSQLNVNRRKSQSSVYSLSG